MIRKLVSTVLIIKPSGPETTVVKIRVGILGDEQASKVISREISKRLGVKY